MSISVSLFTGGKPTDVQASIIPIDSGDGPLRLTFRDRNDAVYTVDAFLDSIALAADIADAINAVVAKHNGPAPEAAE